MNTDNTKFKLFAESASTRPLGSGRSPAIRHSAPEPSDIEALRHMVRPRPVRTPQLDHQLVFEHDIREIRPDALAQSLIYLNGHTKAVPAEFK
jgi:hypothetical protein